MALKTVIESLDDVPEVLHAEYVERDGHFVLQLAGINEHPEVVNLKTAHERQKATNRTVSDKLRAAEEQLAVVPEDFDVDEWLRLKALAKSDEGDGKEKGGGREHEDLKRMYEDRVRNITAAKDREISEIRTKLDESTAVNRKLVIRNELERAMDEARIAPDHRELVRDHLLPKVKVNDDDGELTPIVETDLNPTMPVVEYVAAWAQSDRGRKYVIPATGGDAKGGTGRLTGENPFDTQGGKVKPNLTKQQELISANPEKARQLAKAAGVTPNW